MRAPGTGKHLDLTICGCPRFFNQLVSCRMRFQEISQGKALQGLIRDLNSGKTRCGVDTGTVMGGEGLKEKISRAPYTEA